MGGLVDVAPVLLPVFEVAFFHEDLQESADGRVAGRLVHAL
jgi:hypothetical protein